MIQPQVNTRTNSRQYQQMTENSAVI